MAYDDGLHDYADGTARAYRRVLPLQSWPLPRVMIRYSFKKLERHIVAYHDFITEYFVALLFICHDFVDYFDFHFMRFFWFRLHTICFSEIGALLLRHYRIPAGVLVFIGVISLRLLFIDDALTWFLNTIRRFSRRHYDFLFTFAKWMEWAAETMQWDAWFTIFASQFCACYSWTIFSPTRREYYLITLPYHIQWWCWRASNMA